MGDEDQRAAYAEQLLTATARIIVGVHDEGPDRTEDAIKAALAIPAPANVDPTRALITVLAAQVDPNSTRSQRLAWVEAPAVAAPPPPVTPREQLMALVRDVVEGRKPVLDLPPSLRPAPIKVLKNQGKTFAEIAAIVGCSRSLAHQLYSGRNPQRVTA